MTLLRVRADNSINVLIGWILGRNLGRTLIDRARDVHRSDPTIKC